MQYNYIVRSNMFKSNSPKLTYAEHNTTNTITYLKYTKQKFLTTS